MVFVQNLGDYSPRIFHLQIATECPATVLRCRRKTTTFLRMEYINRKKKHNRKFDS